MSLEKRRTLMKAFIESQFNYCHERALRTVYSGYNLSFYELLDKDDTFTIHQKKLSKI